VTRILYTAERHENVVEAVTVMRGRRSDSAGRHADSGDLALGERENRKLITSKCRRNGSFVQRLIDLDRELYERRANIGARGEPGAGSDSLDRRVHK
jgi:hypothetical protein